MAEILKFKRRVVRRKKEAVEDKGFIVRDVRDAFFQVDQEYMNGYSRVVSHAASMVYFALCRHAGKEQVCYPSYEYLSKKVNFYKGGIVKCIKELEGHRLIKVDRAKGEPNIYTLLHKRQWRKLIVTEVVGEKKKRGKVWDGVPQACTMCGVEEKGGPGCQGCMGGSRMVVRR